MLDLINNSHRAEPLFNGDHVTTEIATARRQSYLIESRLLVCARYNLFPHPRIDLKCRVWILFNISTISNQGTAAASTNCPSVVFWPGTMIVLICS